MLHKWVTKLSVIFLSLLIIGCDKNNSTEPELNDKDAITSLISEDPLFTSDELLLNDGNPSTASLSNSLLKVSVAIIPQVWGRKIESFNRNIDFSLVTDSTMTAVVTHTFKGFVWIKAKYTPQDTVLSTIKKNFTETTTRIVKFIRIARTKEPKRNWKISEISATKGGTANSQITINEVRFYAGNDTLIITDPNTNFMKFERGKGRYVPELTINTATPLQVRVTVTSSSPDSDVVSVHRPVWIVNKWVYRAAMDLVSSTSNNDGTFTRVYESKWRGVWAGRHHALVSALTRNSIFDDDTTKFSSQIWGVPFIVK